jgi:hypothetical protein
MEIATMEPTKFDNHAPINFENAETLASSEHDGGVYSGIGYDDWYIKKGKMIHFYHEASSGCEYNGETDRLRVYLFGSRTIEEMIQFLLDKLPGDEGEGLTPRIINDLLTDLGYAQQA